MNSLALRLCGGSFLLAGLAFAQQQPPTLPPLLGCGVHGDAEVLCGTKSPEDLELAPDGKHLLLGEFVRGAKGGALSVFDLSKKTYTPLEISSEPLKDWGDTACPGPPGDALTPHGISLSKRSNGKWQLYVVNHAGRESIEMYEIKVVKGSVSAVWHGCVVSMKDFNDVAALANGGFIATHPTALQVQGQNLFEGKPSGFVVSWMPGKGETELEGTRQGYPNGVIASADGRYVYYNAWTAKEVHKYDAMTGKETGMVKLDFMPDNLTWTKKGRMLAAGVKGTRGDCGGQPCIQSFAIAEIDPATMKAATVYDSAGKGALIGGVSVALEAGSSMYIGAFQGDRLVKVPYKK